MKKTFLFMGLLLGSAMAKAQVEKHEDRQETDQDRMQQEPPRPTQATQERAARIDAKRTYNEKIEKKKAKKLARKEKRAKVKTE